MMQNAARRIYWVLIFVTQYMGIIVAVGYVRQVNKAMLGKLLNGRCARVFS